MVYEPVIKPTVFLDVEEALFFYDKISHHLAIRFYQNFLSSIEEITQAPDNYLYVIKPVRRHVIKKFPYSIYYIVSDNRIIMLGVAHTKKSNRYIKSLLKKR